MKTERAQELLNHFKENGVSHEPGTGLNLVLEYQDIIGRCNKAEIVDFEQSLDQAGRKLFIWVNFLTLNQDTAIDLLKSTVIDRWLNKHADMLEEDYNEKLTTVYAQERILEDSKKAIYKRIGKLENENAQLKAQLKYYKGMAEGHGMAIDSLQKELSAASCKAQKFDTIKQLLA